MCEFWIFVCSLVVAQEFANLFLSGSVQYALTNVLLSSLTNMFLRFIHACVYPFLFHFPLPGVPLYVDTTPPPFTFRGQLACFQSKLLE